MKRFWRWLDWVRDEKAWFVRYKDGKQTVMCHYDQARDLAKIFGGTVHHKGDLG